MQIKRPSTSPDLHQHHNRIPLYRE